MSTIPANLPLNNTGSGFTNYIGYVTAQNPKGTTIYGYSLPNNALQVLDGSLDTTTIIYSPCTDPNQSSTTNYLITDLYQEVPFTIGVDNKNYTFSGYFNI